MILVKGLKHIKCSKMKSVKLCHSLCRYEEDYERLQAMNELLESEEAPLPQAALQQWLQKLDVGWNKLLEMWESRREVLVQAHIFHLFLRDVKQAESFLNNQVRLLRKDSAFLKQRLTRGLKLKREHWGDSFATLLH